MGLIRTKEELQAFVPVSNAFDFKVIQPFIENNAVPDLLVPALSQAQYDALHTKYNENELQLSADEKTLLKCAQRAIAHFGLMLYLDWAQVNLSQDGIHITVNDTRKTAFQWQIKALMNQCSDAAYRSIEQMLVFLELKKTTFTAWAGSSSATIFKECFITTAEDFSAQVNINNSRRTFLAVKPMMKRLEERMFIDALCQEQYDEIKAEILAGTISANNAKLLKFIKPAIANLTMASAILELSLRISDTGIEVASSLANLNSNEEKKPVDSDRLSAMEKRFRERGESELTALSTYLQAKASDTVYPLFYASENYEGPPAETGTSILNPNRDDGSKGGVAGF